MNLLSHLMKLSLISPHNNTEANLIAQFYWCGIIFNAHKTPHEISIEIGLINQQKLMWYVIQYIHETSIKTLILSPPK